MLPPRVCLLSTFLECTSLAAALSSLSSDGDGDSEARRSCKVTEVDDSGSLIDRRRFFGVWGDMEIPPHILGRPLDRDETAEAGVGGATVEGDDDIKDSSDTSKQSETELATL